MVKKGNRKCVIASLDETLNRGPDSLWSLKNPLALLVKSRGVTPVSWPNSHHWPLSIMAS